MGIMIVGNRKKQKIMKKIQVKSLYINFQIITSRAVYF